MASRGTLDVSIIGDSRGVDLMVSRLSLLLGPAGMAGFLGGQVTPYLKTRAKNRFANEGDEVSGPWMPLSPATVQIRSHLGFPGDHPINHRTGALERWVTDSAPNLLLSPVLSTLTYPGNPPSGKLLQKVTTAQTGNRAKGAPTSPRPVLGLDATDYVAILAMLATSISSVGVTGVI
jgi:hypothetical protein